MNIIKLSVLIKPNAKENKIIGWHGEHLKIAIKSAPVDGKANKTLIAFLAEHYKVSKDDVKILQGKTSQYKKVEITERVRPAKTN